jgi:hypothetical protein
VFRPVENGNGPQVEFSQFDSRGGQLAKKLYNFREYEGGLLSRERSKLFTLMSETLSGYDGGIRDGFLLVHPVNPREPEAILQEENYRAFSRLKKRIGEQIVSA